MKRSQVLLLNSSCGATTWALRRARRDWAGAAEQVERLLALAEANGGGLPGRGVHSATFQLNLSTFCGTGGAFRGCLGGV
jgi:hypothetical protein